MFDIVPKRTVKHDRKYNERGWNPIQSNPIQSNPIQSNPIQSNPIQSNPIQLKSTFKKTVVVTPEYAAILLKNNICNRPLAKTVVNTYADYMKRNTWVSLPQSRAITINAEGFLIDGQYRLNAIIKSGVPQEMDIWQVNTDKTAMFLPFDIGKKRTASDITGMEASVCATINVLYYIAKGNHACPFDRIQPFIAGLDDDEKDFLEYTAQKRFSGARQPLKAGMFFWFVINKDKEKVYRIFEDINKTYPEDMTARTIKRTVSEAGHKITDGGRSTKFYYFMKTYSVMNEKKSLDNTQKKNIEKLVKDWTKDRF